MADSASANSPVPLYARLAALLPLGLFAWLCTLVPAISRGESFTWEIAWLPQRGISLGFLFDGLSLLFALLVTGIGAFILLYASEYMRGYPQRGRFTVFLTGFMLSMLGLVLSDNLIALFVFWELTAVTSFLLIGYFHQNATARRAALQGLLVTGAGALAMLAGFVLLADAAGTYSLSEMLAMPGEMAGHPSYLAVVLLVFAGAFTKSAQFPFHFWLPNAMEAPTPVSAYLHSATMVKAGVFLLARLTPVLGDTPLWMETLTVVGAVTAVWSALVALAKSDLKQVLAYTTVMALGVCVMFLGSPTAPADGEPPIAIIAAIGFVFVHALYKAALFMVAGTIDRSAGTRDLNHLGGLRSAMPMSFAVTVLAALSMAGLPPFVGFVGKELLYSSALSSGAGTYEIAAIVAANVLIVAAAMLVVGVPFAGERGPLPRSPSEGRWPMWIGSLVLGLAGLACGLVPAAVYDTLLLPAAAAVAGHSPAYEAHLWHGFNTPLLLTLATLAAGAAIYRLRSSLLAGLARAVEWLPVTGDKAYNFAMDCVAALAHGQTRLLQCGIQRRYILIAFATLAVVLGTTLWVKGVAFWPSEVPEGAFSVWLVAALIAASALATIRSNSRLLSICALGVVGTGAALLFLMFGAPDVAMTQLMVETLVVVLVAIVLLKLPDFRFEAPRSTFGRCRDAVIAIAVGATTALVLLAVTAEPPPSAVQEYYEAAALPEGHGRNVVNVILVDFRALDTLGEISVLAIASAAAFALIGPRFRRRAGSRASRQPAGNEEDRA